MSAYSPGLSDPNAQTIETYNLYGEKWLADRTPELPKPFADVLTKQFLPHFAPGTTILEIGSGPGYTAEFVERLNYHFQPSDATPFFVHRMFRRGLHPLHLNILNHAPLQRRYPGIWAGAVFHHFSNAQLPAAFSYVFHGLDPGGWFGLTARYGYKEFWDDRLGSPRFYNLQSQLTLRNRLYNAGFAHATSGEFKDEKGKPWVWAIAQRSSAITVSTNATSTVSNNTLTYYPHLT